MVRDRAFIFANPRICDVRPILASLLASILLTAACSDGGAGGSRDDFDAALRSAQEAIRSEATEWAGSAADVYFEQFQAGGKTSYGEAQVQLEPGTRALSDLICQQLKERDELTDPDRALDVERELPRVVVEATMTAIARRPALLYELGMTTWGQWPPFMFKDPAPPADAPVEGLPDSLGQHMKPEFVDEQGGLKIPGPGDPAYEDFRQWYLFDPESDNRLFERSSVTTGPIRQETTICLNDLLESR
jgi:hypothetical protein